MYVKTCQKSRMIGCVIPHGKLQRGITQPILRFFLTILYIQSFAQARGCFDLAWLTQCDVNDLIKSSSFPISGKLGDNHLRTPSYKTEKPANVLNLCQKRRIGCVIPYCNLQRRIMQPIHILFWHICKSVRHQLFQTHFPVKAVQLRVSFLPSPKVTRTDS